MGSALGDWDYEKYEELFDLAFVKCECHHKLKELESS
jgi:hypothetical protein